ncbi:hypothetical protein CR513_50623, partial [Mucuna pruriens]
MFGIKASIDYMGFVVRLRGSRLILETFTPLLSLYNIFLREKSVLRTITKLVSTRGPYVKKYVQSLRMDQCSLKASAKEQENDILIILQSMTNFLAKTKGNIPINNFKHDKTLILIDKVNKHFIWDVDPNICDLEYNYWKHCGDTSDEKDKEEKEERSGKKKIEELKPFTPLI